MAHKARGMPAHLPLPLLSLTRHRVVPSREKGRRAWRGRQREMAATRGKQACQRKLLGPGSKEENGGREGVRQREKKERKREVEGGREGLGRMKISGGGVQRMGQGRGQAQENGQGQENSLQGQHSMGTHMGGETGRGEGMEGAIRSTNSRGSSPTNCSSSSSTGSCNATTLCLTTCKA